MTSLQLIVGDAWAGVVQVMVVASTMLTFEAPTPSKVTVVVPRVVKSEPVIVTNEPPPTGPWQPRARAS